MELQEILSVAIGTLVVVVIAHFAVFWVVRTLYPPSVAPAPAPVQIQVPVPVHINPPAAEAVFMPSPVLEQHVTLPTYETAVPAEAPREERRGPPPPEDTSIKRKTGLDSADA